MIPVLCVPHITVQNTKRQHCSWAYALQHFGAQATHLLHDSAEGLQVLAGNLEGVVDSRVDARARELLEQPDGPAPQRAVVQGGRWPQLRGEVLRRRGCAGCVGAVNPCGQQSLPCAVMMRCARNAEQQSHAKQMRQGETD